jgi:hypothetical protein
MCDIHTDITEFKNGYQTKLNLGKDDNGNLLEERGSVVVKALCYKLEGRGFKSR